GQYHDHETGLHYNRYRYYDPRVGRFVSQDPIRYTGGLNLFAYTPNPIFWVDTRGLTPTPLNEPGYIVYGLYKPDDEMP
ncbi:RHS repeat-associated core domain-containing protein, partial [Pseudomonas sp. AP-1]|uniref:RHS repeat-associated core domain-containing protein n=1 Tax=Pseudomonas TaxID=286 RepID=UPI0035B00E9F